MSLKVYLMNSILKPCPVCGKRGELSFYHPHGRPSSVVVECQGHKEGQFCFCHTGEHKTMQAAVKAWNRRIKGERIMIDGLKICPCCGERPIISEAYNPDFEAKDYIVICPHCKFQTVTSNSKEDVISLWNTGGFKKEI